MHDAKNMVVKPYAIFADHVFVSSAIFYNHYLEPDFITIDAPRKGFLRHCPRKGERERGMEPEQQVSKQAQNNTKAGYFIVDFMCAPPFSNNNRRVYVCHPPCLIKIVFFMRATPLFL